MAEFKTPECHCHPRFDVGRKEHERTVFDDKFEIGVEKLEHQIEICL